ncbi:MAG: GNAT family N-acetyltransferase [Candidatus Krumholzibacteriia bacterium]
MELREVRGVSEFWMVLAVRSIVFVEEQKVAYSCEVDDHEEEAVHVLGTEDDEPVACGRLRLLDGWSKLERVAVRPAWRGRGYGRDVVEFLLKEARQRGYARHRMHAQAHLVDYYRGMGFVPEGDLFQECGIDHYAMVRVDAP